MKPIRLAIVGAGYIGQAHLQVALKSPDCVVSAIVDPAPQAATLAASAGVAHFSSIAEMLAQDKPVAVILATPNQLHHEHALQCMEAGLAILLEKPIASTVADAQLIVQAVDKAGARLLIGHHRAHSPIMTKVREVIASGVLGRLVAVTGSATFFKPEHYFADAPWRREAGAGPILLNMIHEVHNLRMMCGEITAVQAFASHAARGFPVEDTVSINLRFANGALGSFMLSDCAASARSWEQTSQENKAYPSYADEDCYVISGSNGSLSIPTMRLKTYPRPQDRSWWKPFDVGMVDLVRDDPLKHQLAHFCALARGQAEPLVSAYDGMTNLRITEAIATAAASGTTVQIAP
ncbi:MAG: Gfo/Idh/MocA family oxidoreductase [Burkholderiaceae bacterium]